MKWELHTHTAETSGCSLVPAWEVVSRHLEAGFTGIVITDHYSTVNLHRRPGTPLDRAKSWLGGFQIAREAGEKLGLVVLFGTEITLSGSTNDFLIYGAEPELLLENPELYKLDLPALHALVKRRNALMIQAHPNRLAYCSPANPADVDGYEVFNGNPRHDSHNELTAALAKKNPSLIYISGSDYHQIEDLGLGSMETDRDIHTSAQLADCLRSKGFTRTLGAGAL